LLPAEKHGNIWTDLAEGQGFGGKAMADDLTGHAPDNAACLILSKDSAALPDDIFAAKESIASHAGENQREGVSSIDLCR
jgi:hypothetical protein